MIAAPLMFESGCWLDYSKHLTPNFIPKLTDSASKLVMKRLLWVTLLLAAGAQAQVAVPDTPDASQPTSTLSTDDIAAAGKSRGKVGLVRGTLKRFDPVHDRLVIRAFGGGEVKVAFGPRTQFLAFENARRHFSSIPVGSVVSVDTVVDSGNLYALSVRTGRSNAAELNGQVVRYDASRSHLILRDPVSPKDASLRITPSTTVVKQGEAVSPQVLSPGMLVHVAFFPSQNMAKEVEILAKPGETFTFKGRIESIDLRTRVLTLFNDSDQSVRELALGSLDAGTVRVLREGLDVSIRAEFDGEVYNIRTASVESRLP